jgi:signal transduction histidine kinase
VDRLQKLLNDLTWYGLFWLLLTNLFGVGSYAFLREAMGQEPVIAGAAASLIALLLSALTARLLVLATTQPLRAIWQAIWHISPENTSVPAPDLEHLTHGKEVAATLTREIYTLSSSKSKTATPAAPASLLELLPVPVIAVDNQRIIKALNRPAADYLTKTSQELVGTPLSNILHLTFPGSTTLDSWLEQQSQQSVSADTMWEEVRLQLPDEQGVRQFDLAAHFSKDDPNGYEIVLALFDHTAHFQDEETKSSYVAMAVHELRTPLTILRGYIEVFEDELSDKLTPELKDFMHKMSASAQSLTAFVSNILNVARVDENQLNLSLHEANWNELLPEICHDLELRAKVRGKTIELMMTPNLPVVAADKVSIYEVVSNLVDNAIKYSGESTRIIIQAGLGKNGTIDTVVQDFGTGIPEGALKHLFTKYYRSHRTKSSVSGSGLGLYLVKAIITAHGGNVWVNSHEGQGSSFGFSLQPFSAVASSPATSSEGIERHAHGWIKNHSMYRK